MKNNNDLLIAFKYKQAILLLLFSVAVHIAYFSLFNAKIPKIKKSHMLGFNLINLDQFNYLSAASKKLKEAMSFIMPKSIIDKQSLWSDILQVSDDTPLGRQHFVSIDTDEVQGQQNKLWGFDLPQLYIEQQPYDVMPEFISTQPELIFNKVSTGHENVFSINEGKDKISYYIQGPVSSRMLNTDMGLENKYEINKSGAIAKFRIWVTRDGRVNQVIVEESSSFSAMDAELIRMLKSWYFNPSYETGGDNYEWGIVTLKVLK